MLVGKVGEDVECGPRVVIADQVQDEVRASGEVRCFVSGFSGQVSCLREEQGGREGDLENRGRARGDGGPLRRRGCLDVAQTEENGRCVLV